jgi:hypothetical protein
MGYYGLVDKREVNRMEESVVQIPGQVYAHFENDKITKWVFIPSGSDAGYFGKAAHLVSGPDIGDVDNVDGRFWKAVQGSDLMADGVEWEE